MVVDKVFDISDDLPDRICLKVPPFLRAKEQLSIAEEMDTRKIASVRIHVKCAISRIKTFRILNSVFPISMSSELNKV